MVFSGAGVLVVKRRLRGNREHDEGQGAHLREAKPTAAEGQRYGLRSLGGENARRKAQDVSSRCTRRRTSRGGVAALHRPTEINLSARRRGDGSRKCSAVGAFYRDSPPLRHADLGGPCHTAHRARPMARDEHPRHLKALAGRMDREQDILFCPHSHGSASRARARQKAGPADLPGRRRPRCSRRADPWKSS